jgi:hypothetical protein
VTCARGCCATQGEHYRSLSVAHPDRRGWTKTTTVDTGPAVVDSTEHWHDRQDVLVKPRTVKAVGDRSTGRVENT